MNDYILKHDKEGYVREVITKNAQSIRFEFTLLRSEAKQFSGSEPWNVVAKLLNLQCEPVELYCLKDQKTDKYLLIEAEPNERSIVYMWVDDSEEATTLKTEDDAQVVWDALFILGVIKHTDWISCEEVY